MRCASRRTRRVICSIGSAEVGKQVASNADDFIAEAQAKGLSADAAVELASSYGMIPADVNTTAEFEKWKAEQELND